MTIGELTTLQDNTEVTSVSGNVKRLFDVKQGKRGPFQGLILADGNDEVQITLWGHPMIGQLNQLDNVTLTSTAARGMYTGSYNGKPQLNVNKSTTVSKTGSMVSDGGAPKAAGGAAPSHQPSSGGMDVAQLTDVIITASAMMRDKAREAGFTEKVADQLAIRAGEYIPLWWFGQKTIDMPKPPLSAQLAKMGNVPESFAKKFISTYCFGEYGDETKDHAELDADDVSTLLSKASVMNLRMNFQAERKNKQQKQTKPVDEPQEQQYGDEEFDEDDSNPFG